MKITINIDDELTTTLETLASDQNVTNEEVIESVVRTHLEANRRNMLSSKIYTLKSEDLTVVEEAINSKYEEVQVREADIEAQAEVEAMVEEIKSNIKEDIVPEEVK